MWSTSWLRRRAVGKGPDISLPLLANVGLLFAPLSCPHCQPTVVSEIEGFFLLISIQIERGGFQNTILWTFSRGLHCCRRSKPGPTYIFQTGTSNYVINVSGYVQPPTCFGASASVFDGKSISKFPYRGNSWRLHAEVIVIALDIPDAVEPHR